MQPHDAGAALANASAALDMPFKDSQPQTIQWHAHAARVQVADKGHWVIMHAPGRDIKQDYTFDHVIGQGQMGAVGCCRRCCCRCYCHCPSAYSAYTIGCNAADTITSGMQHGIDAQFDKGIV
jgi:hypothetical protein